MMTLLFFLYFFSGLKMNEGLNITNTTTKPMMCAFSGNKMGITRPEMSALTVDDIPLQCPTVIFTDCHTTPTFSCNTSTLKAMVELNFTVILKVFREYEDWLDVLKSDGNASDAKTITDYATANGANGALLEGFALRSTMGTPDGILATNVIPYLKQLKSNPDFTVGVSLDPYSYILYNPNVFNYETSNELVNFYLINSYQLNPCFSDIFNGDSPVHSDQIVSLENVITTIESSTIDLVKIYLVIDLFVDNPDCEDLISYGELCTTKDNIDLWCAPTTINYYEKAKYISDHHYGIVVYWIEFDDIQESCGCSRLIGMQNIIAGYDNKEQRPCDKFNIKDSSIEP